jgi:hypothetical protein
MARGTRTRRLAIVAQDPGVRLPNGAVVMAAIEVPMEPVEPGPCGHRIKVVDYDASTDLLYAAEPLNLVGGEDAYLAQIGRPDNLSLVGDRRFHAQNVYAIALRVLTRFERALGRRVAFSFDGHQLHIAPHAFADANAFYSEESRMLCFGYFQDAHGGPVFTCLAHDVIAHETAHALLDALKTRYTDPSSPDQAGFHEGFADVVALLSVFALEDVLSQLLPGGEAADAHEGIALLPAAALRPYDPRHPDAPCLENSVLVGLAEQLGVALSAGRDRALRRSVARDFPGWRENPEFEEPHLRGEVLVAGFMRALLRIWRKRLGEFGGQLERRVSRQLVVEEGAKVAEHLLNMAIRALDYAPPTDIQFADYLSALLTADAVAVPDDWRYQYRRTLAEEFAGVGIEPAPGSDASGCWQAFDSPEQLDYSAVHADALRGDREELFRFVWDNRKALDVDERAYTRVLSVRPAVRVAPDGFVVRETVADYLQILEVDAGELKAFGVAKPPGLPDEQRLRLYGGGALIFDEHSVLRYHVNNRVLNPTKQSARLAHLARMGYFVAGRDQQGFFARLHRLRMGLHEPLEEGWSDVHSEPAELAAGEGG